MDSASIFAGVKDEKAGELAPYLLQIYFKIGKNCIKKHSARPQSHEVHYNKLCMYGQFMH